MNSIRIIQSDEFPPILREMHRPPSWLALCGTLPPHTHTFLTVVGSRRSSEYGKAVTEKLITGLRGHPVVIVSGLAYGIDALAHRAALNADIPTIAIPGSGLDESVLYPRENVGLAEEIVRRGGALLSPFENTLAAAPWTFPERNRIMAGISHATLVIEARIRSGTLITSKFAGDFNRDVLAVPGSIFNTQSAGPHMLIRLGATPITCTDDLISALGFTPHTNPTAPLPNDLSPDEKTILAILSEPHTRDELLDISKLTVTRLNIALSLLEIKSLVTEKQGKMMRNIC